MAWKTGVRGLAVVTGLLLLLLAGNCCPVRADSHNKNNLIYHLFVRSWADTPADTNEIGDLRGIREKLDYLNDGHPETDDDLEVGILWLMPIFPSPSYHGYDIIDYQEVNPSTSSNATTVDNRGFPFAESVRYKLSRLSFASSAYRYGTQKRCGNRPSTTTVWKTRGRLKAEDQRLPPLWNGLLGAPARLGVQG